MVTPESSADAQGQDVIKGGIVTHMHKGAELRLYTEPSYFHFLSFEHLAMQSYRGVGEAFNY